MIDDETPALRRAVAIVAALNFAYFGVEFTVATLISSVALFADSIDFLEDTAVNLLILAGLHWSARRRAQLGMAFALVLLLPGIATLLTAWQHGVTPGHVPAPMPLTLAGFGALSVNLGCALLLVKVQHVRGSLTRAAFLSARNDTIANVAIIAAGGLTALTRSFVPDLVAGLGIFLMNLDAARQVYVAAHREHQAAHP